MRIVIFILFVVLFIAGCGEKASIVVPEKENIKLVHRDTIQQASNSSGITQNDVGPIDYIKKTGFLYEVKEVKINADNSITLSKEGNRLRFSHCQNAQSITLNAGKSCKLLDYKHMTITYLFKKLQKNQITFLVRYRFNATSFGDGIKRQSALITIAPYKDKNKLQQKTPLNSDSANAPSK